MWWISDLCGFCSEWLTHQHRDTLSSIVGHPTLTSYLAIADNEAAGRIRFEMTEVGIRFINIKRSPSDILTTLVSILLKNSRGCSSLAGPLRARTTTESLLVRVCLLWASFPLPYQPAVCAVDSSPWLHNEIRLLFKELFR